jgi:hypothetical protein
MSKKIYIDSEEFNELIRSIQIRIDTQQMISAILMGLIVDEKKRTTSDFSKDMYKVLNALDENFPDNEVVKKAVIAVRSMLN